MREEMYLKIQDLIKIKSYQGIRRKIDNSTFPSKPFQVKLFIKSVTKYTIVKYLSKFAKWRIEISILHCPVKSFLKLNLGSNREGEKGE